MQRIYLAGFKTGKDKPRHVRYRRSSPAIQIYRGNFEDLDNPCYWLSSAQQFGKSAKAREKMKKLIADYLGESG
jgi:hypothetical protein